MICWFPMCNRFYVPFHPCHLEKSLDFVKIFFVGFLRSFGGLCATSPLVSNLQSQSSLTLFTIFMPQNDQICHSDRSVTISTLWDFCHLEKSLDFVKISFFRFSRHFVAQNDVLLIKNKGFI